VAVVEWSGEPESDGSQEFWATHITSM
jgi:hypothetical protein